MLSSENLIFLVGSPRSGTTWIGKIFDSNPEIIYRHEPDASNTGADIPNFCNNIGEYIEPCDTYVNELIYGRDVRSSGKPPIFDKHYRSNFLSAARKLYIYSLRYGGGAISSLNSLQIPDLIGNSEPRVVIKSVRALGRAGLFTAVRPDCRLIHILRHPCGHVGSILRGQKLNKMPVLPLGFEVADTAALYGLTREKLQAMPIVEQAAWRWVVLNHKAMQDLQDNPNVMTLIYEDLCASPTEVTRKLFDFTGLGWWPQTAEFLQSSATDNKSSAFHNIYRDPLVAANKWQEELTREEIDAIMNIVRDTPPGKLFEEQAHAAG